LYVFFRWINYHKLNERFLGERRRRLAERRLLGERRLVERLLRPPMEGEVDVEGYFLVGVLGIVGTVAGGVVKLPPRWIDLVERR
jgi:hypothetical protein